MAKKKRSEKAEIIVELFRDINRLDNYLEELLYIKANKNINENTRVLDRKIKIFKSHIKFKKERINSFVKRINNYKEKS